MAFEYVLKETDDFYPLSVLLHSSGLGIDIQKDNPPGIVKMWRLEEKISGELAGTAVLQIRDGVPCLGGLAVAERFRNDGCGSILQNHLFKEARLLGYRELWVCAKQPEYYEKFGWEPQDWDRSPNIALWCPKCSKYGSSCHPKKLLKVL